VNFVTLAYTRRQYKSPPTCQRTGWQVRYVNAGSVRVVGLIPRVL